jgi:hypothetical protein
VVTAAVVATFTTTDCISPALIWTDGLGKVQVGGAVVTVGVIAQLKLTVPENKLLEASVSGKLAVCPALMVWVIGDPEAGPNVKAWVTVSVRFAVCVNPPEVPVTVTDPAYGLAVALVVSVSVLLPVAGFGLKAAVMPLGNPEAESDTLPLNPSCGVIVIVLVPWLPCVMFKLLGLADSV